MSGREDTDGDGSFLLESELLKHASGRVTTPNSVTHRLRFSNYQLCDLRVDWKSEPEQPFLDYSGVLHWTGDMVVQGASKPRTKRRGDITRVLRVASLPAGISTPLQRKIPVEATLNVLDGQGDPTGAVAQGWKVLHQLQLT